MDVVKIRVSCFKASAVTNEANPAGAPMNSIPIMRPRPRMSTLIPSGNRPGNLDRKAEKNCSDLFAPFP